jgi:N6-L-threonylcarbamoyladenine synthase
MITLGIESSCDETSAALLDNERVVSNAVYSQVEHSLYGGVVPEIASRAHLEKIEPLTAKILQDSSLTPRDIDLIAVTDSPGLAGALLVGISFALGMHVAHKMHITGINHLEGHIASVLLAYPDLQTPFLALVASGGHTAIYQVNHFGNYTTLGQTVDDAAGEAFDKVGKLLGLPYPAGRVIEQEALKADPARKNDISFPVARVGRGELDFSFSGLKTAVKYYVAGKSPEEIARIRPALCRAFQNAVVNALVNNCAAAVKLTGIERLAVTGGVACNGFLRQEMKKRLGDTVYSPPPSLCTDNAAMIALAGYKRFKESIIRFPRMDPSRGISDP